MTKKDLIRELEQMTPEEQEKGIIQYLGSNEKITGKQLLDELKKPPTLKRTTVGDVVLTTLKKKLEEK